ncbi:MAG: hypothetical protein ABSA51_03215 [Anaerolineaceae bacterium]|jgi:hypothetical protein
MGNQILSLTTAIAVYGAVIATLSLIISTWLGILKLKSHKPNIKISLFYGNLFDANGEISEPLIIVEAINIGTGAITITSVGWLFYSKEKLVVIHPYKLILPIEVYERKKITFYFPCRWLNQVKDSDKITAVFFSDETNNTWKCKISKNKLKQWKNSPSEGWQIEWNEKYQTYL